MIAGEVRRCRSKAETPEQLGGVQRVRRPADGSGQMKQNGQEQPRANLGNGHTRRKVPAFRYAAAAAPSRLTICPVILSAFQDFSRALNARR